MKTQDTVPWKKGVRGIFGFTLIELIVVITILVILGTIAFINLGGFSGSARDSSRISNLANLKKGLDIYQIKVGTYPMPEGPVTINASGSAIIGYQGFAKEIVGSVAKLSNGATKDPSDATIFTTYSVNANQTKMQAMVFLEDASSVTAFAPFSSEGEGLGMRRISLVPTAFASSTSDYSQRIPRSTGDSLGILLDSSTGATKNQPVQELLSASFTGVDVVNTNSGYMAVFSNKTSDNVSGTGFLLSQIKHTMVTGGSKSPWCDTYDIAVGNQVWSACNAGATTIWTGQTFTSATGARDATVNAWAGGLYQWGNNVDVSYTGTTSGQVTCTNTPNWSNSAVFRTGFTDWCTVKSDNLWGNTTNTNIARQGPCATGYHVPSQPEWASAVNVITGQSSGWVAADITVLQTTLKLPMSGIRNYSGGSMSNQWTNGLYWSSSPNSTYNYYLYFTIWSVNPVNYQNRAIGIAVRCLKN